MKNILDYLFKNTKKIENQIGFDLNNIDDYVKNIVSKVKIRGKITRKKLKKYGYEIAGNIILQMGNSNIDDEIIITLILKGVQLGITQLPENIKVIAEKNITDDRLQPILQGAFLKLNEHQKTLGKKLIKKGTLV